MAEDNVSVEEQAEVEQCIDCGEEYNVAEDGLHECEEETSEESMMPTFDIAPVF